MLAQAIVKVSHSPNHFSNGLSLIAQYLKQFRTVTIYEVPTHSWRPPADQKAPVHWVGITLFIKN